MTVRSVINTAAAALTDPGCRPVWHLGIDEHRYRQVRFFCNPDTGKWCRYEAWMSTVAPRQGVARATIGGRRDGVQVVAIDPSAAFRKAITDALPHASVSVDHFYADVDIIDSMQSNPATTRSPRSANESSARPRAGAAARPTRPGPTDAGC